MRGSRVGTGLITTPSSSLLLDRSAVTQEVWLISERLITARNRSESNRSCERVVLIPLPPSIVVITAAWIDY